METLRSNVRSVIETLGVTYRQLDHLRHLAILPPGQGSGSHYVLDADQIARLTIAAALYRSAGGRWTRMARAVITGPPPPASGWVVCRNDTVLYGATFADVLDGLPGGGVVAQFGQAE